MKPFLTENHTVILPVMIFIHPKRDLKSRQSGYMVHCKIFTARIIQVLPNCREIMPRITAELLPLPGNLINFQLSPTIPFCPEPGQMHTGVYCKVIKYWKSYPKWSLETTIKKSKLKERPGL